MLPPCSCARAARTKCTLHVVLWRQCPTASAKAAARVLAATEQVHDADIERTKEVENARGGDDDDEDDDTDEDPVSL